MTDTPRPILGKASVVPVTQERKPWRATVRTLFQAFVSFCAGWALVVEVLELNKDWQWVSVSLAITAAVTRVMALPGVNRFLARFVPFLAPDEPARILGKA